MHCDASGRPGTDGLWILTGVQDKGESSHLVLFAAVVQ